MPETINTGTALIEEVALLPGSLQWESEPWTCFFAAAAIIRELQQASNPVTVSPGGKASRQEGVTELPVANDLNP